MVRALHPTIAVGALVIVMTTPAAAKVVVADFDELGFDDDVYCGSVGNVNYCDVNKYDYGHIAPYLFISDYDWQDETSVTADPGTYFTPLGFEFSGGSALWRLACPGCARLSQAEADAFGYSVLANAPAAFDIYEYDFFAVEGYRDGALVARTTFGEKDQGTVNLDDGFAAIDRLRFDLLGGYFESLGYEEDGYIYTCLLNVYGDCNSATIDNLVVRTDAVPAPIPLGASGTALAGGLVLMAACGRRRRGRAHHRAIAE